MMKGKLADHLPSKRGLAKMEWRRTQVDNEPNPFPDQGCNRTCTIQIATEILFGPDVFANGDTEFCSQQFHRFLMGGWLEVPRLIKHVIRRQKRFKYFANRLVLLQNSASVDERFTWDIG